MTVQHDLSLNTDSRLQRRVSNLEQGYVANQQTGAWAKTIIQCGEMNSGAEARAIVNCLSYAVPVAGQYVIMANNDIELSGVDGFPYTVLTVNNGVVDGMGAFNRSGRHPASHSWGGYLNAGDVVAVQAAINVPQSEAFIAVHGGDLVIVKIA